MRTRLLVVVSVLVVAVVVGLGVPLAVSRAATATADVFADRLGDTTRFAALAQRPVTESDFTALAAELARYDELYGAAALVLDRDGRLLVSSRPGALPPDDARVALALAGQRSEPYPTVWPWEPEPMLLAEPVLVGGEVRAVAVTLSPTTGIRTTTLLAWTALVVAGVAALAVAALAALPLVRWILAPVDRLDAGTARVAAAVRAGRRPEPVGGGTGPPELRRLTRDFDAMAATVAQALESQRAFVADASHQLRNPLTALRLRLQNVEASLEAGDTAVASEEHAAALEEAEHLAVVLESLLALARAEGTPVTSEDVDVDTVVADRAEAWEVLAEHEGLSLRRTGPPGLTVRSDPAALATVLDAALDNAVAYAPAGTEIEVSTARREDEVEIVVRDHGPGLDPDELPRATDRFWRGPAQQGQGTGLGLAIAAHSAERAGGRLLLSLPGDGGLAVALRLPRA